MESVLNAREFDFISKEDRRFILDFTKAMSALGYGCDNKITPGYCWGKYMILYRKQQVKSDKVYARIYIRDDNIVLRLYFSRIDRHSAYIEKTPDFIKSVFTGAYGDCKNCHNEKDGKCSFRKSYTLENRKIDKCNGVTFEFYQVTVEKLSDLLELFSTFYPVKKKR
ncbi:hypothetical protein ACR6HW_16930 [Fusibacter sp. JL298sf-3]